MTMVLAQHENELGSVVSKANQCMDNLIKGVMENNIAINYIRGQLQQSTKNLEMMFQPMNTVVSQQIQTSYHINHELDQLKLGVIDLVNRKLSPLLLPHPVLESTFKDIQQILTTKFPGFHLNQHLPFNADTSSNVLYARNQSSLFITVNLPVSHSKEPLQVYNVILLPIPINSTSTHATHLLNLPENLLTVDHQFYAFITDFKLSECKGKAFRQCPFNIALKPITTDTCILVPYVNIKEKVKALCDFRFIPLFIQPEI